MPSLVPCSSCRRHILVEETVCPFCAKRTRSRVVWGAALMGSVLLGGCDASKSASDDPGRASSGPATEAPPPSTPNAEKTPEEPAPPLAEPKGNEAKAPRAVTLEEIEKNAEDEEAEQRRVPRPRPVYGSPQYKKAYR